MTITSSARARAALALLALCAAGLTSAATASTAAPATDASAPSAAAPACAVRGASAERVRGDAAQTTADPDDLTSAQTRALDAGLHARLAQRRLGLGRSAAPSRRIDVYVHVIEKKNGKGGVSTTRIKKQIAVLNQAYAGKTSRYSTPTGFTFRLKKIDRTKNSGWYSWSLPDDDATDDLQAKTKLHRGGADDLNLYVTGLEYPFLGYATYPDTSSATSKLDGVVLLNASLPGGSAKPYDRGDTAVHEVGHWLGLLHTFENDCAAPGDGVADTPAQSLEQSDFTVCDPDADTCAADPGHDPVHNFMNYTDDACLNRFTPGQTARMVQFWNAYRSPVSPA